MTRFVRFGFAAALAGLVAVNFASCTVDKSAFTFDDDEFARVSGDGEDDGSGGSSNPGGIGGEGGTRLVVEGKVEESCDVSAMRCTGRQVEFCTGSAWIAAGGECEFACVAGACSGICVPGDKRCESDIEEQTCNDLGQWDEPDFCEFACVGDSESGECGGECLPGNAGCGTTEFDPGDEFADTDLIRCSATGEWEIEATCPGDCSSNTVGKVSTAQCTGSCTAGD